MVGSWSLLERARSDRLVGGWPRSPGGGDHDDEVDNHFGDVDIDDGTMMLMMVALITW